MSGDNQHIADLIKLQAAVGTTVHKDTEGHGYKYIKLDKLMRMIGPKLVSHNFALVTTQEYVGDGVVSTRTALIHTNGQAFENSVCTMVSPSGGMIKGVQYAGSVVTFCRRYSLMTLLGLAASDDDDGALTTHEWLPELLRWIDRAGHTIDELEASIRRKGWKVRSFDEQKQRGLLGALEAGTTTINLEPPQPKGLDQATGASTQLDDDGTPL